MNDQKQNIKSFYSNYFDDVFDRVDIIYIDRNINLKKSVIPELEPLKVLIYEKIKVKLFKNKHFTGITVYILSSFLSFLDKYSEIKIEKL